MAAGDGAQRRSLVGWLRGGWPAQGGPSSCRHPSDPAIRGTWTRSVSATPLTGQQLGSERELASANCLRMPSKS